jgi:hypothetical protein
LPLKLEQKQEVLEFHRLPNASSICGIARGGNRHPAG